MIDGQMLTEKSKEELIRIILEKDKLVDELEQENKELREKVKVEQQKRNEKFAKSNAAKKRSMRPEKIVRTVQKVLAGYVHVPAGSGSGLE